jgi:hypothetical protein
MRSAVAATTCALVLTASLGLSACGGGNEATDKMPTSAPALLPPDDANDLASGTGTSTTTSTTTTDTTSTDTTGADTDTGGTADDTGAGTDTGGTDTGTDTGGADTDTDTGGAAPNPGGVTPDATAGAGSFQGFCDANPGAC